MRKTDRGETLLFDALVIGAGPAGLAISAALCDEGLNVAGLAPVPPPVEWPNTYGIWCDELAPLNLMHLLSHRWQNSVAYTFHQEIALQREYGLFDNTKLQNYFVERCDRAQMQWYRGMAAAVEHGADRSIVTTPEGKTISARVVVDASGHRAALLNRPNSDRIAYQAAYGIIGRFSSPPIAPQQFVLMDYRSDHLSPDERQAPPTFLYAMDLGNDVFFVEETSLANRPAVKFETLQQRLEKRLAFRGVQVKEVQHVEYCLFPMNLPLPSFDQAVTGFGGAASMVHPASGYMVGALLRRAPGVARAIGHAVENLNAPPVRMAAPAWQTLWSSDELRKRALYLFGLENLMRFDERTLQAFFTAFFQLPKSQWSAFLANTLSTPELLQTMMNLFGYTTYDVRWHLIRSAWRDRALLWKALVG